MEENCIILIIFLAGGIASPPGLGSSFSPILRFRPFLFWIAAANNAEPLTVRSDALDAASGEDGREEPVVPPTFLGVLNPVPI